MKDYETFREDIAEEENDEMYYDGITEEEINHGLSEKENAFIMELIQDVIDAGINDINNI